MLSFDKCNYVLRRLFDESRRGLCVPDGLNRQQRAQFAIGSGIFTDGELTWLRSPDPELADEHGQLLFSEPGASEKVRIGFVQSALARVGGIEVWLRTLAARLTDVELVGAVASAPYCEVYKDGIPMPVGIGRKAASGLVDRVDVLVVSNEFQLARILKRASNRPKIILVHHGDETCAHSARVVQSQAQLVDCLVTVNPRVAHSMRPFIDRVVHIPNAADPSRSIADVDRATLLSEVGLPLDAKVVLYSGRFSPEKGYALAREIGMRLPDGMFMVLMGGMGDAAHPKLRYVGQQAHPGNWYHVADVAISPSLAEGAGIGMMELAIARVPLIATRRGIIDVHPEMAQVMAEGSTAGDWVEAIVSGLADPIFLQVRTQVAEHIVQSHYSVDDFASRWQSLIMEVAGERSTVR